MFSICNVNTIILRKWFVIQRFSCYYKNADRKTKLQLQCKQLLMLLMVVVATLAVLVFIATTTKKIKNKTLGNY